MKNLTLSAASRKSSTGVVSSPRPSISGGTIAYTGNNNNFVTDSRMTSVDEELASDNLLSINNKLKDPRVCNERSDSGFSECSNCSTPSASCVCHLAQIEKSDTIIEEQYSTSTTAEPCETQSESRSEISSLEYDDVNKGNCDNNSQNEEDIVLSIRVPTRRELYQNDVPKSEIERRKVSLENDTIKKSKSGTSAREEFSLEKLKKTSKVALLMEKFESTTSTLPPTVTSTNFKFKAVTNDTDDVDEGLIKSTTLNYPNSVPSITNNVKICDLTKKEVSLNTKYETNQNSNTQSLVAKHPSPAATRKSPTNHTTTFRLSDRVREATERLSKPKQQASPTSMDKTTKASILTKQNSNFARSKEFWKR